MSGKKQHHIWQMIQRGFSWRERGDDHIWVYSKEAAPRQTVTRKYGQEKAFYGEENSIADINITNFENQTQELIHSARDLQHGEILDSKKCASYVAHLEMRSNFIRSEMSNVGIRLFGEIRRLFDSKESAERLIGKFLENRPEIIEDELLKHGVPTESIQFAKHVVSTNLPQFISSFSDVFSREFQSVLDGFSGSLVETAKSAHNKSLENSFFDSVRADIHGQLRYIVHKSNGQGYILPDTCLAVIKADGCAPISSKADDIEAIFCPVSSTTAIVGVKSKIFFRDEATLNKILASCSFGSFIANRKCSNLEKLANKIGKNAKLLSDSEIRKLASFDSFVSL